MANIFLIVEGQTEETFYKRLVPNEYRLPDGAFQHYFHVVTIPLKRDVQVRTGKGGSVSYAACVDIVRRYLRQATHCELVVLVLDYYGLHDTFKTHLTTATHTSLEQKILAVQDRLEAEINVAQFRFRLQIHEFEAYHFSNPDVVARHFGQEDKAQVLNQILGNFDGNPELINDHPDTAPSKRLETLFPGFEKTKTTDGIAIAEKTGIGVIRQRCQWFDKMCRLFDELS